jgi:hypothetical protein
MSVLNCISLRFHNYGAGHEQCASTRVDVSGYRHDNLPAVLRTFGVHATSAWAGVDVVIIQGRRLDLADAVAAIVSHGGRVTL